MRQFLFGLLVALVVPAHAVAGGRVSAFYYPWYGTSASDGSYQHWSQDGHAPPNDIASSYYPAIGLYSSSDKLVIDAQMSEIRSAGIDEIAVSWWGQGSPEDLRCRRRRGRATATGSPSRRTSSRTRANGRVDRRRHRLPAGTLRDPDVLRLPGVRSADRRLGAASIRCFIRYRSITVYAQTALAGAGGRRTVRRHLHVRHRHVRRQHVPPAVRRRRTRCTCSARPPSGPGYDARRGSGDPVVKPRRSGAHLRRDVARGDRERRRPRHDHVVQRVARGHADRAGGAAAGAAATATSPTTAPGASMALPPSTPT